VDADHTDRAITDEIKRLPERHVASLSHRCAH
jgi:hypothetical protein